MKSGIMNSRRSGLVNGVRAAFAAPAVVAALRTGVAHAGSGTGTKHKGTKHKGTKNTGTHAGTRAEVAGMQVGNQQRTGTNAAFTTATHTHTGTGTRMQMEGLNSLFSGSLKSIHDLTESRGAVYFFGLNGAVSRIFLRLKKLQRGTTYRLAYSVSGTATAPNDRVALVQLTTNGDGGFRQVVAVNNLSLNFAGLTFFLQRLDGTNWTDVLQLVQHKA